MYSVSMWRKKKREIQEKDSLKRIADALERIADNLNYMRVDLERVANLDARD